MMGWLKNKAAMAQMHTDLSQAFSKIREDLGQQRRLIEDLHTHHHGFKKNTSLNHQRMADWITYFEASLRRLEQDMKLLEKRIQADFDVMGKQSLKLFQEAYAKNLKDSQALKQEILREVEVFLQEKAKKPPINNVDNVDNVRNVMPETHYDSLSNPEKWLVGVLFNTETPLSYTQIAEKTGKTVNTVRVYMNQLKFKGFVEESTLPNGTKIFSLKHRAKVKKLYNLN